MIKQKQIQQLSLLIAVLAFASCQPHNQNKSAEEKQRFIPIEYRYPTDKIGNGKTYVYTKAGDSNDTVYNDLHLITENGIQYFLVTRYNTTAKLDSMKLTTWDKEVEVFSFRSPDFSDTNVVCLRGEIKEDTIIDNGTELGKYLYRVVYLGEKNKVTVRTEEEYLKDTVLLWNGREVNCIVVRATGDKEFAMRGFPFLSRDLKDTDDICYAKGIGMLQFTMRSEDGLVKWELVDLRDMK